MQKTDTGGDLSYRSPPVSVRKTIFYGYGTNALVKK